MAMLWGDASKDRELALLRRRVSLLEEQVRTLAAFSGMDPHHMPREREVLGERAQHLALHGKRIAAVKAHREEQHLDLRTAARDVELFMAHHEAV